MIGSTLGSYRILDKLGASHGDLDEFDVARDVRFLIVKAAATSREIPQVIRQLV